MTRMGIVVLLAGGLMLPAGPGNADRYPFPALEASWSGTRMMESGGMSVSSRVYQTPEKMRDESRNRAGDALRKGLKKLCGN